MKVSVITPTFGRERMLPALYAAFRSQTHDDLELLVHDDSPSPSPFLSGLADPRIRYFHSTQRMSVGEKRNFLVGEARGEIVACFDDDDYYAPVYVEAMLQTMGDADLVKLGGWFALSIPDEGFFYWDTSKVSPQHLAVGREPLTVVPGAQFAPDFLQKHLDGFGFSLVFKRSVHGPQRFADRSYGEDQAFVAAVRAAGKKVKAVQDDVGVAIHILHDRNSSVIFPQYALPTFIAARLLPDLPQYLKHLAP